MHSPRLVIINDSRGEKAHDDIVTYSYSFPSKFKPRILEQQEISPKSLAFVEQLSISPQFNFKQVAIRDQVFEEPLQPPTTELVLRSSLKKKMQWWRSGHSHAA